VQDGPYLHMRPPTAALTFRSFSLVAI
jgi:hypothetical protein